MKPAAGYDAWMPHDLLHLVVEAKLGLTGGVFGQLAAGGDAGTFSPNFKPQEKTRVAARVRQRLKARGKTLIRDGRDESAQSERATFICWYEWLARSPSSERRTAAQAMAQQARQIRDIAPAMELRALNERKLEEILEHLDELSSHWYNLDVGQSMTVSWPDLAVSTDPPFLFASESNSPARPGCDELGDLARNVLPNTSLDASGESVFPDQRGAADGPLIRAAASTQPLGALLLDAKK